MPVFHQISSDADVLLSMAAVAAGTSDTQTGVETVLTPQYNSVIYMAYIGTITTTGTATLQAKGSFVSGTYGAGTVGLFEHVDSGNVVQAQANGSGDSGKMLFIDIYRTGVTYARCQIVRATANAVIGCVVGQRYTSQIGSVVPSGVATLSTLTTTPGYSRASNPTLSTT